MHILGEEVGFEVHGLANLGGTEVGFLEGVGSDPEDGGVFGEFRDGERDAIDAEGSFIDAEGMN